MNHLDCDWKDLLQKLTVWDRLSLDARCVFLDRVEPKPFPRERLAAQLAPLARVGFVHLLTDDRRARLPEDLRAFRRAMRALRRHPLFNDPDEDALAGYIIENFTRAEGQGMLGRRSRIYAAADLARKVGSFAWPEEFLKTDDAEGWENRHDGREYMYSAQRDRERFFAAPRILEATRAMWRWLGTSSEPRPIAALQKKFRTLGPADFAAALFGGIRYALMFPALDPKTLQLRIGVWPAIAERLNRPPVPRPAKVQPKEVFEGGYFIEDMIQILTLCCAEPPRLRVNDARLFARTQRELLAHAMEIPAWVQRLGIADGEARLSGAVSFLADLGLVDERHSRTDGLRLVPTEEGRRWLELPEKERLLTILDPVRAEKVERGEVEETMEALHAHLAQMAFIDGSAWELSAGEMTHLCATAIGPFADGHFVELAGVLAYAAENSLPLDGDDTWIDRVWSALGWYRRWREPTPEQKERDWQAWIYSYLVFPLLPLGVVRLGRSGAKGFSIAVTPMGRYVLGLEADFEHECAAAGEILVQPNFEVVFLAPSPAMEARIARFAKRRGRSVGTLFEITRGAIFDAAASGMTADEIVGFLREASRKPIPANVTREIEGWFARCRQVTMNPAVLIHCPDAETAARVLSAGGKMVRPVTETVVELISPRNRAKLIKRLREAGVFVG